MEIVNRRKGRKTKLAFEEVLKKYVAVSIILSVSSHITNTAQIIIYKFSNDVLCKRFLSFLM